MTRHPWFASAENTQSQTLTNSGLLQGRRHYTVNTEAWISRTARCTVLHTYLNGYTGHPQQHRWLGWAGIVELQWVSRLQQAALQALLLGGIWKAGDVALSCSERLMAKR